MNKPSIYGLAFDELAAWLESHGHKKHRALQVWDWLYRKRVGEFAVMSDVHESCRVLLEEHFAVQTLEEHTRQQAADGTIKFLFRLADGDLIETVLMRHKYGLSVCVTTQVGCNIGCSFCASGTMAKKRDLDAGELTGQIMKVQSYLDRHEPGAKVSHLVVMGIGEPLDNWDNLMSFLRIVMDQKGLVIGPRHITVSTSGLVPRIRDFADAMLKVNLAVSLHAPNDELRTRIMKINRAYPLRELMDAIHYYQNKTGRRITLEYILLQDVNDQPAHALELVGLIGDRKEATGVNLIPYNPVDEFQEYKRSSREAVDAFYDVLKKHGINSTIRQEQGADIDAACGQLRSKQLRGV
ncbi:23S rRNA (adenine(2503)-C(2))-methyltransferase RlmN [Paenibacillus sp. YN15]|uniref:23S rRNA (adenine(2503)-C(2))-methyltransferase RlmN n=1 Tax=Paenibacillus sp. YN15 TaxID=1742774 RepID=UPI000DCBD77E|nr:23S rRNA (adenine(2503)-C(2))-methyltransferase RlmN [Paenibacillus sp. YN15]RAU99584.1 23S rRNA (adenine(2503)-C(2))-methyltransferase RlmN [Paenibacillus sp. YN15]